MPFLHLICTRFERRIIWSVNNNNNIMIQFIEAVLFSSPTLPQPRSVFLFSSSQRVDNVVACTQDYVTSLLLLFNVKHCWATKYATRYWSHFCYMLSEQRYVVVTYTDFVYQDIFSVILPYLQQRRNLLLLIVVLTKFTC